MRRLLRSLFTALLALTLCGPAAAQGSDELERAKASFKAGANAYAAGDYLAAIQALETAYDVSPLPANAFSLAQAERKQYFVDEDRAHLERAISLFHRYLVQEPRGARREDARLAIAQLEPLLGNQQPHEPAPKAQVRPTRLMIVSDAPGARITLDGAPAASSPLIREVTPGKHRARVSAAGYLDVERDVTAVQGELLLSEVQLAERPSMLYVWAPLGADIYIDGVYVAQGGERASVPVAAGVHQLSVAKNGCRLVRRDIRVERGRTYAEQVSLERTTQRTLAELLFISGGTALGASLVWSALAIQSENKAEDFLRRRNARNANVTSAELIAYQAAIVERNRYRTVATVSVAGAFGMFVTGLFLHELDQPSAPATPRRDAPSSDRAWHPRFSIAPLAAGEDVGASFQVNF